MKELKVISLYFFLIVNLFSGLHLEAKSIVSGDIVEGQAYQPNFLKQKGHFEKNANGTTAYADAAGTRPVDGSGGAPTLSCTRTTSSPIDGDGSLLITKDAANRQGQGCSIQFTIDSAYKAKVLQIEFDYLVASGTFTAGSSSSDSDLIVYIYDVTNSTLIEPSSIKLLSNSSTISDHFVANFQTSATGTTYNLILHQATTSSSAYTVKADNLEVKPSRYVYGTPISDWVSYTVTPGATNITATGVYRRVGDSLEARVQLVATGVPVGNITASIPSGLTIDTSKLNSASKVGFGYLEDNAIAGYDGFVYYNNTTSVGFSVGNASGTYNTSSGVTTSSPFSWGSTDFLRMQFSVPITGWSSSTQVSDGYDGRQIAASYTGTSGTITAGGARFIVDAPTKVVDKTSAVTTGASWKFTAPSSGTYQVSYVAGHSSVTLTTGAALEAEIYKNGSFYAGIARHVQQAATAVSPLLSGSLLVELNAGDYIDVREAVGGAVNATISTSKIDVYKLQAPTTMSATERVSGLRNSTSGQSISANTETTIQYANSEEDTHGMWSTSTHDWTVPVAGRYSVNGFLRTTGAETVTAGQIFRVKLYVDGSYAKEVSFIRYLNTVAGTEQAAAFSGEVKLNAGQKVSIVLLSTVACTLSSSAGVNWAGIKLLK